MKNIWKLLMIALLAFAMIGCPATKENDDDDTSNTGTSGGPVTPSDKVTYDADPGFQYPKITGTEFEYDTYKGIADFGTGDTKATGLYTFTGNIADISDQWGGNAGNPQFSVLLLDELGVAAISDTEVSSTWGDDGFKKMPVGAPAYQLQGQGNNTFQSTVTGTFEGKYKGVVAVVDKEAGTYKLYVDLSKILKGQVKGLGQKWSATSGEKVFEESDALDLTGFTPYVLALKKAPNDATPETEDGYIGAVWGGSIYAMDEAATGDAYPTNIVKPKKVLTHIIIKGDIYVDDGETHDASADYVKNVTWRLLNVAYYDGQKVPYQFYAASNAQSGTTVENATHGALLTVNLASPDLTKLADFGGITWEKSNGQQTSLIFDYYKKLALAGESDKWIGFDSTDDSFDCKSFF